MQAAQRPFVTETMAELYLKQGFRTEALAVYEQLSAANPTDERLAERVASLRIGGQRPPLQRVPPVREFFARFAARRPWERAAAAAPPSEDDFASDEPEIPAELPPEVIAAEAVAQTAESAPDSVLLRPKSVTRRPKHRRRLHRRAAPSTRSSGTGRPRRPRTPPRRRSRRRSAERPTCRRSLATQRGRPPESCRSTACSARAGRAARATRRASRSISSSRRTRKAIARRAARRRRRIRRRASRPSARLTTSSSSMPGCSGLKKP